jgi:hypothetical protein
MAWQTVSFGGLDVPLPILIGIIIAIVSINLAIALTWCVLRRRTNAKKKRKSKLLPLTLSTSSTSVLSPQPTSSTGYKPEMTQTRYSDVLSPATARSTVQQQKSVTQSSRPSGKENIAVSRSRSKKSSVFKGLHLNIPSSHGERGTLQVSQGATALRRGNSVRSVDSESIYSTASAPLDSHDRVFQPWRLDPIPSSPAEPTSPSSAVHPLRNHPFASATAIASPNTPLTYISPPPSQSQNAQRISLIREPLAPETYNHNHRHQPSQSLTEQYRSPPSSGESAQYLLHPQTPLSTAPLTPPPPATHSPSRPEFLLQRRTTYSMPVSPALPPPPMKSPLRATSGVNRHSSTDR